MEINSEKTEQSFQTFKVSICGYSMILYLFCLLMFYSLSSTYQVIKTILFDIYK